METSLIDAHQDAATAVTLWFRTNEKGEWMMNHLEDGHFPNDLPTPKMPSQKSVWGTDKSQVTGCARMPRPRWAIKRQPGNSMKAGIADSSRTPIPRRLRDLAAADEEDVSRPQQTVANGCYQVGWCARGTRHR